MFLFLIFPLLITNISCYDTICVNSEGCPQIKFTKPQKWCTVSSREFRECLLLAQFASILGFSVECVGSYSKQTCLEAIRLFTADIVAVVNLPLSKSLTDVITTTTDTNPVDLTTVKDSSCVFKLHYDPNDDERIESSYLISDTWKCTPWDFKKVLCVETNPPRCNYVNDIVMRKDDPNIPFVKYFLMKLFDERKFFEFIFQNYTNEFYVMSEVETTASFFGSTLFIFVVIFSAWIGVWVVLFVIKKKFCEN